ncbi:MAG TPA: DNA alkylation repair protein [Candidatus Paceibacterota bacterium]
MKAGEVQKAIRAKASTKRAKSNAWYFKTGKGEYGYGDKFTGLTVPEQREIAKRFRELPLSEVKKLLVSAYHEDRFVALEILVMQYGWVGESERKQIAKFYLQNKAGANNWDLVDTSAPYILGHYLFTNKSERGVLMKLAGSKSLWDRRIAIVSTLYFIGQKRFNETLEIAKILLKDKEDLIHKAVGWALREVWKRDPGVAEAFLTHHKAAMPRTTLRYAIERMSESKRKAFLAK